MKKDEYLVIELPNWISLNDTVKLLQKYNKKGIKAKCYFNEQELLSDNITLDKAYLQIHNKTKEEYEKEFEIFTNNYFNNLESQKKHFIDYYIDRGNKVIKEDKKIEWMDFVYRYFNSINSDNVLYSTVVIMEIIKAGINAEILNEIITKEETGLKVEHIKVDKIIKHFSPNGELYYGVINGKDINININTELNEQELLFINNIKDLLPKTDMSFKGYAEDRVCLNKINSIYSTFIGSKGEKNNIRYFDTFKDAVKDMLYRGTDEEIEKQILNELNNYDNIKKKIKKP